MFKYYFESIENVATGPVISLIIFFAFFIALIIWLWRMDKKHVDKMKNLPLDESDEAGLEKNNSLL